MANYKQPQSVPVSDTRPDKSSLKVLDVAVGGYCRDTAKEAKSSGIKIRGTGAATKGTKARGPMA